jgi:cysteinyl-tRNA synthetase
MTDVLGISPEQWPSTDALHTGRVTHALMNVALAQRAAARARGDFGTADAIRRQLADVGITVQDTEGETRWKLSPSTYV